NPGNNLHVSNLSLRTRSQDLEKLFGEYGKVHIVTFDPHTQESRGFGFVTFQKAEHAEEARVGIDGRVELDSKVLRVQMVRIVRLAAEKP
ncbi:uncharacterized protein EV422DRAFT_495921, partial [Fimicolochytrium jonesii]|uniref:uncharacterized protein n=1 Tax=Fimicolochytrium jonesii TaxID=1396493 RepID=UPI0022FE14C0